MKTISLFMDVEDPINPMADDAALDFPVLFSEVGVTGCFCLTGEKCRKLAERNRCDVALAYSGHSLGLHTNAHSFHPSTMELLADVQWDEGCDAIYEVETRGFEAFVNLFERAPEFWGGGGNTWSPEVTDALKRLNIPAYVYALTQLPNHAVHKFNGVIALPQALSISESEWAHAELSERAQNRVLDAIKEIDQPWIGVFVGHPTRFRHADWWDVPYYGGRTPTLPEYTELLPVTTYEQSKLNLRTFLGRIMKEHHVVGIEEALALTWSYRQPSDEEIVYFQQITSANLRAAVNWPVHYPGMSAELIVNKTMALTDTLQVGFQP